MIAYHSIFSLYGFWLPNDPRGSGSDYVAVWELFRYGPATKTDSRRSVAAVAHDNHLRQAAKQALRYPPVTIDADRRRAVARGFQQACLEAGYRIHACAVLREHVHLVVAAHDRDVRRIVGHLKSNATRRVKESGLWPDDERPLWGDHGWNVYLDDLAAVARAIAYVEQNPLKEGLPSQAWPWITPFDPTTAVRRPAPINTRKLGGAALRSRRLR